MERIVHVHIPKTAGTALKIAVARKYGDSIRIFPEFMERKFENINFEEYDFFSGHIGMQLALRISGRIVVVLRNPIDRFISVYYFWRQLFENGVEVSRKTTLASKYSLGQFVRIFDEPLLVEEFFNRATWQLAGGSALHERYKLRLEFSTEEEILNLAQENLQTCAVVGIQENMPDLCRQLKERLDVDIEPEKINVTQSRELIRDIDHTIINRIYDWVYLDMALYYATSQQLQSVG